MDDVKKTRTQLINELVNLRQQIVVLEDVVVKNAIVQQDLRKQAECFKVAVDNSSIILAMADLDLRYTWIYNPHPDFESQAIVGKRDDELAQNEGGAKLMRLKQRAIDTQQVAHDEIVFPLSNGNIIYAISANPLWNEAGEVMGVVTAAKDVSAQEKVKEISRQKAGKTLRESEENLRVTLNSIGDGVIATDAEGCITRMNPVAEKLTGWSLTEAMGKPLATVFYIINEATREIVQSLVEKVLEVGTIVGLANHTILIAKNGREYQIADSGAPIRDEMYNIIGVVLVFRDVTDAMQAEKERNKIKKLESLGVLAGGIAHDFNNLLTSLYGNIELAKIFLSGEHKAYDYLEHAEQSMYRATQLTTQLLTFAKGGVPIKQTLSIGDVLVETATFSLRGSNVKLVTDIAPNLWLVEADKGQLSQVISNLVINANQAMPLGGILTLSAKNMEISGKKFIEIVVEDKGVGILPQYLDRVFDPYFSTKQKGSGLGLASTYSIISLHHGHITVDSQVGQGTTFTIQLPAIVGQKREVSKEVSKQFVRLSGDSSQVLVLDDEETVRNVIGNMLVQIGCIITYAVDGQEAVEKYRKAYETGVVYDVVIMDLTIPGGMGGEEAAQKILQIDPEAKMIVSSGYATDPVLANYKDYGFRERVIKPYRFTDLQRVLLKILKQ